MIVSPARRGMSVWLLLHANETVSEERLAVALWGDEAPTRAVKTIQVYVSRLRQALGASLPFAAVEIARLEEPSPFTWQAPSLRHLRVA